MRGALEVLILGLAWVGLSAQSLPSSFTPEQQELLRVEAAWNDAIRTGNAAQVEALVAPDFELIASPDSTISRAAMLRSVANPGRTISENGSRAQSVRTYGDTGVITGIYFERGIIGTRSYSLESRYTDVYVRRATGWLAVSAHASVSPVTYRELR